MFWYDVFQAWYTLQETIKPQNWHDIQTSSIRCNKNIKVNNEIKVYENWVDAKFFSLMILWIRINFALHTKRSSQNIMLNLGSWNIKVSLMQ